MFNTVDDADAIVLLYERNCEHRNSEQTLDRKIREREMFTLCFLLKLEIS